ncbi:MAG TPA: TIGR02594 family protein [Pseudolabrys sp.]|jgi:uncharacterized protein (TIGR02594 family)|nr:TIGR02594 family protein [Pseudolabrys sp.]
MRLADKKRATLLLCTVAFAVISAPAIARPAHKHVAYNHHAHHYRHHAARVAMGRNGMMRNELSPGAIRDDRYPVADAQAVGGEATQGSRRTRRVHTGDAFGGFTSNSLVSEARSFMGTNPTGWSRQWCGAFMDLVLKKTGHRGGGNLAIAYARYGTRVSGPQVGAIAVMRHHVGVVSGIDANGNPIIVSGNHNRTVAESVYPRSRIAAYVLPNG